MSLLNIPAAGLMQVNRITEMLQTSLGVENTPNSEKVSDEKKKTFAMMLEEAMPEKEAQMRISSHAKNRMENRGIELDPKTMGKLNQAMDMAAKKGARESLVVVDDKAFVVNVENRTVVTALNQGESSGRVFTQIDSTVFV